MATVSKFKILENQRSSKSTASGDFEYIRDFVITDNMGRDLSGNRDVNGYILQLITKSVNVSVPDAGPTEPSVLTTTQDVLNYTSDFVGSMSDSYVEAFIVINGKVLDGDMFRNSSILRYNQYGKIDTKAPNTSGIITQVGKYYFVPTIGTTIASIKRELANEGIIEIKTPGVPNPANGLPCSTNTRLFTRLRPNKSSPVYKFMLTVEWEENTNNSIVTPYPQLQIGGSYQSKTRKNRNNKRHTRKVRLQRRRSRN